jgi:hypothetical protein
LLGEDAFVRFRGTKPVGGLAPAHFEAISLGVWNSLTQLRGLDATRVRATIIDTVQTDQFKSNVGSGSNSLPKFRGRVAIIEAALSGLS